MGTLSTIKLALESFLSDEDDTIGKIIEIWEGFKVPILVPLLKSLMYVSLAMLIMLFIEMLYMSLVVAFNYLFGRKTEKHYKWEEFKEDDELGSSVYPLVLVQIPLFNEKEVYQLSIGAACGLSWPSDRLVIQVLDDSTDPVIKGLVEVECENWASKGTNIHYQVRDNRKGYKAGALKEGLMHHYANECEYVAIFDADFQPEHDFLRKTIPYLHHNSEIGLVQACWKFVNSDECLMTRIQEMSLNYHFKVEQEFGSSTYAFFGFNGTAGVWRMVALNEAGGWNDRTTVEDMDMAIRASLKGWKFLYLGSIKVKSELPSTLKAYRYQQHRWSCGAANLFRKMAHEIIISEKVTLWKKLHIIYSFFFVRKIVAHIVTSTLYCVVITASVWIPEVEVPTWGTIYIPTIITTLNVIRTPRSLYLVVFWIVFENAMSLHRTKATFIGIFEAQRVNEWVVTEKRGDASKAEITIRRTERPGFKLKERLLVLELCVGIILFVSGCYNFAFGKHYYYIYLFVQSIAFVLMGFGLVGTQVPNS